MHTSAWLKALPLQYHLWSINLVTNNYAHKIIQREDVTNDIHNMAGGIKAIMKILNNGENTPPFAIDINQDKFMSGFRQWREQTATSQSGRHLGQYKALLRA